MDEYGQVGVLIQVDAAGIPWLGEWTAPAPALIEIPTILSGLRVGQAMEVILGGSHYWYRIDAVKREPPRYGRKWFTRRAELWKWRHWATTELVLILEPAS